MKTDTRMEELTGSWRPISVSKQSEDQMAGRKARGRTRSPSRRYRSEASRNMLELLRALAQSEAANMQESAQSSGNQQWNPGVPEASAALPESQAAEANSSEEPPLELPGLHMLRAHISGGQPDDSELHCRYCNRVFRLTEGGACFDGNAACASCEQHLNRDVVLPAVGKNKTHSRAATSDSESSKRARWAEKRSQHQPAGKDHPELDEADEMAATA